MKIFFKLYLFISFKNKFLGLGLNALNRFELPKIKNELYKFIFHNKIIDSIDTS